jgi:outer membrane protein OmpA-like peptidoglycan-associated protein
MRAQRRDAERRSNESVERMWQVYADHIGLPKAGEAASEFPRRVEAFGRRRRSVRLVAESFGRIFGAVAVVMVVVIAGITLWLGFSTSDTAARRSQKQASAPAGEAERVTPPAAPGKHPGEGLQTSPPPVPVPREKNDPAPVPPSSVVPRRDTPQPTGVASTGPRPASTVMDRISFDFGSEYITDESKPILDKIAAAMKANAGWRMAIEGHTDAQGTPDFNRALSERRAQVVKAYLQAAGIAPGRLSAVGFGASRPVAPNDASGNVLNRRVEFRQR